MFTDYTDGLLQVHASIRRFYGLPHAYRTDQIVDQWLDAYSFQRIFVILIDGMGSEILKKYAHPEGYFMRHLAKVTETVYPPTTVAATTAIRTGLSPSESGWLGWNQHFNKVNDEVLMFFGKSQYTDTSYGNRFAYDALPVKFLEDELCEKGYRSTSVWPAWSLLNPCKDYADILNRLVELQNSDYQYVYAYWDLFDTLMHQVGPSHPEVKRELDRLDTLTEAFMKLIQPDTGVLILADHGQLDVENIDISKDEQLCSCLACRPSLETRTISFFIKQGQQDFFQTYFNQNYGQHFALLSHDEVVKQKIFGPHNGPHFEEFIGDFVAFAKDQYCLGYGIGLTSKGQHAGTTKDEMMIPIILSD